MRIVRFTDEDGVEQYGVPDGERDAWLVSGGIYTGFIKTDRKARMEKVLSPVEPTAILCIGLNYRAHAMETGADIPDAPVLFMKNPSALNHPGALVNIHDSCQQPPQVDYEVELAVVIGKDALNVPESDALDYVLGYTIANDVSARRWQKNAGGRQWIRGKSFDGFCPMGPCLVLRENIPDPQKLDISLKRNGEVLQQANTSDMIFSVAELISKLSQGMTLAAGTVILTGTPSGVGFTREPPVYLMDGDLLELTIDGIGTLSNTVAWL